MMIVEWGSLIERDEDGGHVIAPDTFLGICGDEGLHEIFNYLDSIALFVVLFSYPIYHSLVVVDVPFPYTIAPR